MTLRWFTALAVGLMAMGWSVAAHAQSCCAASQTSGPARLSAGHAATIGTSGAARINTGVFSHHTHRQLNRSDYELRQTLFGGLRINDDWQIGASTPLVLNYIRSGDSVETGAGIGDTSVQTRWELVPTTMVTSTPGVGLVGSVTAPTGTSRTDSMNNASTALQADVTGTESWRFELGAQLEWAWQHWYLTTELAAFQGLGYTDARGEDVLPGTGAHARLSAGRTIDVPLFADNNLNLGAGITTTHQTDRRVNGDPIDRTAERTTTLSAHAGGYLTETLQLLVNASWDLPVYAAGANRYTGAAAGATLRWIFWE